MLLEVQFVGGDILIIWSVHYATMRKHLAIWNLYFYRYFCFSYFKLRLFSFAMSNYWGWLHTIWKCSENINQTYYNRFLYFLYMPRQILWDWQGDSSSFVPTVVWCLDIFSNYLPKFASFHVGGTLMITNSIELHTFHRSCLKYYWIIGSALIPLTLFYYFFLRLHFQILRIGFYEIVKLDMPPYAVVNEVYLILFPSQKKKITEMLKSWTIWFIALLLCLLNFMKDERNLKHHPILKGILDSCGEHALFFWGLAFFLWVGNTLLENFYHFLW